MNTVRIGFTGTRQGMTVAQKETVTDLLEMEKVEEVHHGDCVGADADFHDLCYLRYPIVIHPPTKTNLRAWRKNADIRPPKGYLARDRDIVDQTDELIAAPADDSYYLGSRPSGTWYTIQYARHQGKPVSVVWPDGSVTSYSPPIECGQIR